MAQMIANAIRQAGTNFVESLAVFLPRIVTTLAIIIVGWLIAMLVRTLVRRQNFVSESPGRSAGCPLGKCCQWVECES